MFAEWDMGMSLFIGSSLFIIAGALYSRIVPIFCYLVNEFWHNLPVCHSMKTFTAPESGSRLLFVIPHPDDEIAGCAGLIRKSVLNGSEVKVVLVTNGDGVGVVDYLKYKITRPGEAAFMRTGAIRQNETRAALELLGVDPENVIFLGFPDGCLLQLWREHWEQPFTSPYTGKNFCFYPGSFSYGATYTGINLVKDLEKIISDFSPTHLIYPGHYDRHTDHFSCYNFIKFITAKLSLDTQEMMYLIHRGFWPAPPGKFHFLPLTPPFLLKHNSAGWLSLLLSPEEKRLKALCIRNFKSQNIIMRLYLSSFIRCNEIFGRNEDVVLHYDIPQESQKKGFRFENPLAGLSGYLHKAADISRMYGAIGDKWLEIGIKTLSPPGKLYNYIFNIHLFSQNGKIFRLLILVHNNSFQIMSFCDEWNVHLQIKLQHKEDGLCVTLSLPDSPGFSHLLIGASSEHRGKVVDSTGVRMVRIIHAADQSVYRQAL